MVCDYPGHSLRRPGKCPGCSPTWGAPDADAVQAAIAAEVAETERRLAPIEVLAPELPTTARLDPDRILWAFAVAVPSGNELVIAVIRDGDRLTAGSSWLDQPSLEDWRNLIATVAVAMYRHGVSDE